LFSNCKLLGDDKVLRVINIFPHVQTSGIILSQPKKSLFNMQVAFFIPMGKNLVSWSFGIKTMQENGQKNFIISYSNGEEPCEFSCLEDSLIQMTCSDVGLPFTAWSLSLPMVQGLG